MRPFVWNPEMSAEETKNGAYWERNMLALYMAKATNSLQYYVENGENKFRPMNGWYVHGEYEGWTRVISLYDGQVTFHVPDDFDLGDLPQIEPNWDGHTTKEKWENIMKYCGCKSE